MKVKDFVERKPIPGMLCGKEQFPTTFDVYTDIKNKRQELDNLISVAAQYADRNEVLLIEISAKASGLAELENQIDLAYEQLEFVVAGVNHQQSQKQAMSIETIQQEEKLHELIQIIKERISEADGLQLVLTKIKNGQIELAALQQNVAQKEQSVSELNDELGAKQALIEIFDRQYAAKLHRSIKIKERTKFKLVG